MGHVPLVHQVSDGQWSEEKSKSAKISCCSAVRKKGVFGGVSTGFRRVNSSSKLLTSPGALMLGRNGGFTRLASKASQSTPCAVTKGWNNVSTHSVIFGEGVYRVCRKVTWKNRCLFTSLASCSPAPSRFSGLFCNSCEKDEQKSHQHIKFTESLGRDRPGGTHTTPHKLLEQVMCFHCPH